MDRNLLDLLVSSFPKILIAGAKFTVPLTVISFSFALIIATVTALVQYANVPVFKQIARFYIWIVRGTPLLVQLFLVFYGLPNLGIIIDAFPAAIIVFSINEGAYAAETIRAAIEAVPRGQIEAGYCVGMNYIQIMTRIVLPQALRTAFPPLRNSLIGMVQDTSLASIISVSEMLTETKKIVGKTFEALALYAEVGLIYLLICTVITFIQRFTEKHMRKYN